MNICFEAEEDNTKLNTFLENWQNPTNPMTIATNSSFVEFKVHKIKDLVIISQKNFYDIVAKFLVYGGTGVMFMTLLIAMITDETFYAGIWFRIGFGIMFVSILWLSPYYRYMLIWIKLRSIGYKGKLNYVSNSYALSKILYKEE